MNKIFQKFNIYTVLCILSLNLLKTDSVFGDWPNWRGPNFNGSSDYNGALPSKFDKENSVKWSFSLPGPSAATPIIFEDLVFIPSIQVNKLRGRGDGELLALCLNKNNGELLWQKHAGSGYKPGNSDGFDYQLHDRSNYASPSPVISGKSIVFFFGNGDLISFDFKGRENWRRNIQKDYGDFCFQWTFSASPTYFQNKLYLPVLQRNEPVHGRGANDSKSFLLCLNPQSGETIWKHNRLSPASKESLESFCTIIPYKSKLLVAGGDVLTAHDPDNGNETWRWGTWNPQHKEQWWRLVPSPVVGDGVALVCAPKRAPVFAIKLDQIGSNFSKAGLRWETSANPSLTSDVPTPLFYQNKFYILSDLRKNLSRVNPKSGQSEWTTELPGKYKWRSSPTAGDGKIYLMNHNGMVLVVSATTGKILNSALFGGTYDDNTRSSIAISGGNLFIRTNEKLYCIKN